MAGSGIAQHSIVNSKSRTQEHSSPFIFSLGMPINTGASEKKMKGILHIQFQKIGNVADNS